MLEQSNLITSVWTGCRFKPCTLIVCLLPAWRIRPATVVKLLDKINRTAYTAGLDQQNSVNCWIRSTTAVSISSHHKILSAGEQVLCYNRSVRRCDQYCFNCGSYWVLVNTSNIIAIGPQFVGVSSNQILLFQPLGKFSDGSAHCKQ